MARQDEYDGYSVDEEDQLQPEDTLDQHGVDDVLDEGIIPRDKWSVAQGFGNTADEMREGASIDRQLSWEEPDIDADTWDEEDLDDREVGDARSGRIVASADGDDRFGSDVGIDGAGASAEEAAMHVIEDPEF